MNGGAQSFDDCLGLTARHAFHGSRENKRYSPQRGVFGGCLGLLRHHPGPVEFLHNKFVFRLMKELDNIGGNLRPYFMN